MKLILQRSGDFLEAYGTDAEAMAKALGIVTVTRGGVKMAGIPVHRQADDFADLKAAGIEPRVIDRAEGLKLVWNRTHRDFKGTMDGKRSILIYRDGTQLVPLEALRADEIARLVPRSEL
jgi:DNA mismatch repair ATPase MutS